MNNPKVSIIMTSYNAEKYIEQAIASVINQTYANWELLIADDCSTDNTKQIIDQISGQEPRIKPSHNSENLHYLKTRNRLFNEATGNYITLLDADDWMTENRIECQLQFMQQNPSVDFVGCNISTVDEAGNPLKMKRPDIVLSHEQIVEALPDHNPIVGSTLFVKRNVLLDIGGYRTYFSGLCSEDYDLFSRLVIDYKAANIPDQLYVYRQFEESTSRKTEPENAKKMFSGEIVKACIQDRKGHGTDYIDRNELDKLDEIVEKLHEPIRQDPSVYYLLKATSHSYSGFDKLAVKFALTAWRIKPQKIYNLRSVLYFFRMLVSNSMSKWFR